MAFTLRQLRDRVLTSIHGRRLGLDSDDFLVGPKALRLETFDLGTSVATTLSAWGSYVVTTAFSSTMGTLQHNLPIPFAGAELKLFMRSSSTASIQFLSTPNGASILSGSAGTTANAITFRQQGAGVHLVGLSTDAWGIAGKSFGVSSDTQLAICTTSTA